MYKFYFDKKPVVENSQVNNVSVFVRHNYLQIRDQLKKSGRELDLNKEEDVKLFIDTVERSVSINLRQERNGEVADTEYMNKIKLTYTRSNLDKGFVFWFICNLCGRRVRNLYFPPNSEVMACRNCHRLSYKSQNENDSRTYRKLFGNL